MRMWYKSITTVYQIVEEGAVPSIRSKKAKKCLTNIIPHGINEYSEWFTRGSWNTTNDLVFKIGTSPIRRV